MEKFEPKKGPEAEIDNELLMKFTPKGERWLTRDEVELALVALLEVGNDSDPGAQKISAVRKLHGEEDIPLNFAKAAVEAAQYINENRREK